VGDVIGGEGATGMILWTFIIIVFWFCACPFQKCPEDWGP